MIAAIKVIRFWRPLQLTRKTGKFGDLKRRLWFPAGRADGLSDGAHIPVPGIDATRSPIFNTQKGGILGMFNMFSGGACRVSPSLLWDHAVHLGIDHHAVDERRQPATGSAEEGRRSGPAQDNAIYPLRHGVVGLFQGLVSRWRWKRSAASCSIRGSCSA